VTAWVQAQAARIADQQATIAALQAAVGELRPPGRGRK
jgi:hypothetical protein